MEAMLQLSRQSMPPPPLPWLLHTKARHVHGILHGRLYLLHSECTSMQRHMRLNFCDGPRKFSLRCNENVHRRKSLFFAHNSLLLPSTRPSSLGLPRRSCFLSGSFFSRGPSSIAFRPWVGRWKGRGGCKARFEVSPSCSVRDFF